MKNKNKYYGLAIGLIMLTLASTFFFLNSGSSKLFLTSVLDVSNHAPFDGTVYPVKLIPDWVNVKENNKTLDFKTMDSKFLLPIPYYNATQLAISADTLKWGNLEDNKIRNAKLTYSTPYMGNYMLDGKEMAGSHSGVDIKMPTNTPVYVIANGVVVSVKKQTTGFGYSVVVAHKNVPTLNDPNAKVTLFSSYSHLSDILVAEGAIVTKGQQIALSGSTGTSTTPHLHFQIDTVDAPFHPFWPFTWAEAQAKGLDFYSAINAGLGKESALRVTVNPVVYVQKFLDANIATSTTPVVTTPEKPVEVEKTPVANSEVTPAVTPTSDSTNSASSYAKYLNKSSSSSANTTATTATSSTVPTVTNPSTDPVNVPSTNTEQPSTVVTSPVTNTSESPSSSKNFKVDFVVNDVYSVGEAATFSLKLANEDGSTYSSSFDGELVLSASNGLFSVDNAVLKASNFKNGFYSGSFRNMNSGSDRLIAKYNNQSFESKLFKINAKAEPIVFKDVNEFDKYYPAISYLSSKKVINGFPDGTFKPNQTVTRVEALKLILAGLNSTLEDGELKFSDIEKGAWYHTYLYTAYQKKIVGGYPDGSFKPGKTVNRAEFYKILFNAMEISVDTNLVEKPFVDVPTDSWFAPYVSYAKKSGLTNPGNSMFYPETGMSRQEVADAIYRVMQLKGLL